MDNFAISLMIGATTKARLLSTAMIMAFCFGLAQAGMILIGWSAGISIANLIAGYGNVIAFMLLMIIGAKMIHEGLKQEEKRVDIIQPVLVLVLSISTSVDSLAAGMSLGILQSEVLVPALIIGIVTFTLSFTGVMAGKRLERIFGTKSDIIGGVILILLGIRFLAGIPFG
jgi:putative Mn2+ efflux pump MntP